MTIFTIFSQSTNDEKVKQPQRDEKTIDQEKQPNKKDGLESDYLNEETLSQAITFAKVEIILSCLSLILGIGSTVALDANVIRVYPPLYDNAMPGMNIVHPLIGGLTAAHGLLAFHSRLTAKKSIFCVHLFLSVVSLALSLILFGTSIHRAVLTAGAISKFFGPALLAAFCEVNIAWMTAINSCAFAGSVWIATRCCSWKQQQSTIKTFLPTIISHAKRIRQVIKGVETRDEHDQKIKKQKHLAIFQLIVSVVMLVLGSISTGILMGDLFTSSSEVMSGRPVVVANIVVPIMGIIGGGLGWNCYRPVGLRKNYILGAYVAFCIWNIPLLLWLIVSTIQIFLLLNDTSNHHGFFWGSCLYGPACEAVAAVLCEGNILWMSFANLGVSISVIIITMTPWNLTLPTIHVVWETPKPSTVALEATYHAGTGTEFVAFPSVEDNAKLIDHQAQNAEPVEDAQPPLPTKLHDVTAVFGNLGRHI